MAKARRPTSAGKMRKLEEDRARMRGDILELIAALEAGDVAAMVGLLGDTVIARRRECELDLLRLAHFHPDDKDNYGRLLSRGTAYTRILAACSAMLRVINVYEGGPALKDALLAWADAATAGPVAFEGEEVRDGDGN